jgi:cytochrome c-type biogenesis protein CcmF
VFKAGNEVALLNPEKRTYLVQTKPMTEAGIDPGFTRDIYVSLGEGLGGGAWSLRLYYKPYIRWIWLGALLIGFGGLLAATDRRYRMAVRHRVSAASRAGSDRLAAEGKA